MNLMWFGYAQEELLPTAQARNAVVGAMHDYAAAFAFGPGRVVIEPTAPERLLRAIVEDVDRAEPALAVMRRLEYAAAARNLPLEQLLDVGSPRTQLLWQVMEEIEGCGGGHLIVPSREHLSGLGPSGKAVIRRLTYMPRARIYYLQTTVSRDRASGEAPDAVAPGEPSRMGDRVLAESTVGAIPTVTRFDIIEELTRRGWPELMDPVDQLYMALADDANAAAKAAGELGISPFGHQGTIRLLQREDGRLVVELQESRHRDDPPAETLAALCARIERFTHRGRTITRCTLSSEYTRPVTVPTASSEGRL
jgi:hypothetical protein